jgi:hypothetical protein
MIPPEIALASWLVVGTFLMAGKDGAKGFSLNMLLALMVLPAGFELNLPFMPRLGRFDMAIFSAVAGTVLFHAHTLSRFRPRWFDGIIVVVLVMTVSTSVVNGHGFYDGIVNAFNDTMAFVISFFLFRIYLGTPKGFRTFLVVLVWCSVVYTPLALWEWRMSPQIHTTLYGYFQHSFLQHARWGFYRPVICFGHGLQLGRFFAFAAFLALFPLRDVFRKQVTGGQWLFLVPMAGLALSMSFSPYMLFAGLCVMYVLMRRALWLGYVLPGVAAVYVFIVFMGYNPLYGMVDLFASVSVDRAESFRYRLDALNEYRVNILQQPILGWGGWGNGRITGRATDSVFLTRALSRGLVGAALLYSYYFIMLHVVLKTARLARGTPIANDVLSIAALLPFGIALCSVDSGLDLHVVMLGAGAIGLQQYLARVGPLHQQMQVRKRAARVRQAAAATMAYEGGRNASRV